MQGKKFQELQYRQIWTENVHSCKQSYFFHLQFSWLALDYSVYPLPLCRKVMSHSVCLVKIISFVSLWVFLASFTIKSVTTCTDRCCDCNTIEKDHYAFYSASTVWFNETYLSNTLYISNDTSVIWSVIIIRYLRARLPGKWFFNELWFEKAEYESWLQKILSDINEAWCKLCHMFMFVKL